MSLTSSMYSGISGLKAFSEKTSVISNNIANSSTVGFKSGSVQFADVFYSALSGGGQVGNGVAISSVDTNFTQGSYESGSSATDMAIGGDGFFIVSDPENDVDYYTRAGNFAFDEEGYLVDSNGFVAQGWAMEDGSVSGTIQDVKLDDFQSPPEETSSVTMSLNLDSSSTDNVASATNKYFSEFASWTGTDDTPLADSSYAYQASVNIYDENGTSHELTAYMDAVTDPDSSGNIVWEYIIAGDPADDLRVIDGVDIGDTDAAGLYMTGTMTFNSAGELIDMSAFSLDETSGTLTTTNVKDLSSWVPADFDDDGLVAFHADFTGAGSTDIANSQQIGFDFGITNSSTDWETSAVTDASLMTSYSDLISFADKDIEASATTCYDASSATYSQYQDGYASGYLENVTVDASGVLSGVYSNGQTTELYAMALADFNNTDGLYQEGGNLFTATVDSGTALTGQAGQAGMGDISSYTLESSNVDMSEELTDLIISQSGFQANSKIITTIDDMLSTVLGMKR